MTGTLPFRTRARAVDHLGRGQIADAPTAVSELWKNAYDAYARTVYLNVFEPRDGVPATAAVVDDGCGMTARDFLDRWLVIGTETKVDNRSSVAEERFGLPPRERQGEKGIGRLSAAFLAPVALLVSKKRGARFVAALIDWRLFENPLLDLRDVLIAVDEFDEIDELGGRLPAMAEAVRSNVTGHGADPERAERLAEAWTGYSEIERQAGKTGPSLAQRIEESPYEKWFLSDHLRDWPAFLHDEMHGTALVMFDLADLGALVDNSGRNEAEVSKVRDDLIDTLKNYVDPLALDNTPVFDYEVNLMRPDGRRSPLVSASSGLGPGDFYEFEHWVEGEFDANGLFSGRLRAYGGDVQDVRFSAAGSMPKIGPGRPGPIAFSVCTFEQKIRNSSHTPETYARLDALISSYYGMNVFRDGLRVMPYGRANADLFELEVERSKNAGVAFWSYRRLFGRVAITRADNPRLMDKAGREGLVDNAARRTFARMVRALLKELAHRYFGSKSEARAPAISRNQARKKLADDSAKQARRDRAREFKRFLRTQTSTLEQTVETMEGVQKQIVEIAERLREADQEFAADALGAVSTMISSLLKQSDELKPPLPPSGITPEDEAAYRSYRDAYGSLTEQLEAAKAAYNEAEVLAAESPSELLREKYRQLNRRIDERITRYETEERHKIERLRATWSKGATRDRELFAERADDVLSSEVAPGQVAAALNALDARASTLEEQLAAKYEARIDSVSRLEGGVMLSAALAATQDGYAELEERVADLQLLAQKGISVEIIGHELETLSDDVKRNLERLPDEARNSGPFKRALAAHHAITDRLRFLSPLQLAGYRSRQTIAGGDIADFIADFFDRRFEQVGADFEVTPAFRSLRITDLPSRINPVFLNLINNSLYWAAASDHPRIRLDVLDGKVVVADSGPGVDEDDVERLFTLFFTRRDQGRGVGLYLARMNLAAAQHHIRYADLEERERISAAGGPSGAAFIIEFRGLSINRPPHESQ